MKPYLALLLLFLSACESSGPASPNAKASQSGSAQRAIELVLKLLEVRKLEAFSHDGATDTPIGFGDASNGSDSHGSRTTPSTSKCRDRQVIHRFDGQSFVEAK